MRFILSAIIILGLIGFFLIKTASDDMSFKTIKEVKLTNIKARSMKILLFIVLFVLSFSMAKILAEKYPKIIVKIIPTENSIKPGKIDTEILRKIKQGRGKDIKWLVGISEIILNSDETTINEGDRIIIELKRPKINAPQEMYASLNREDIESYIKLKERFSKVGMAYYKKGRNKVYISSYLDGKDPAMKKIKKRGLITANEHEASKGDVNFDKKLPLYAIKDGDFRIVRPSFADSLMGRFSVFLINFVLMGELIHLISILVKY